MGGRDRTAVLVVDDDPVVCRWLRMIIEAQPDLEVVGDASDGLAAIEMVARLQPDVVITDVAMAPLDGIETTRRILAVRPATKVVVLTTFAIEEYLYQALRAGASGFLLKTMSPEGLLEGIRCAASGESLIASSMTRMLVDTFVATSAGVARLPEDVSEREREVLVVLSQGLSNQEIAEKLHISVATTKTHVSRLLTKFGARDRAQLVIAAYETGLVVPNRR